MAQRLSIGIVGLPNVGKSTLFNALLKKQAALVANYPFATIEPNIGIVPVPDARLMQLAEITQEEEKMTALPPIKPATVQFVDIAGLVKGASEGAGLGNKFLSHIREVSVIAHVVRAFEDPSASSGQAPIIREGSVGVKEDYETIKTELILADLGTISKIKEQKSKVQIKGQKEAAEKLFAALNKGIPARDVALTDDEQEAMKHFFLLSVKPEIIVLNVSEEEYREENILRIVSRYTSILGIDASEVIVICAKVESDLAGLTQEEQKEYLLDLGIEQSGLEKLIQKAYGQLGLISFLTAGEKEVRAWTTKNGATAPEAAGEIHTDFAKKFIKAEIVGFDDYITLGGRKKAREAGKARLEGKEYVMKDGDVVEFRIGS